MKVYKSARMQAYSDFSYSRTQDRWLEERRAATRNKPEPIYKGESRRHKISQVMDVLRDWRMSGFENEGSCRAGMRSALCLDGYDWHRADSEAASLISTAITYLGYSRPTWDEGQRTYSVSSDYCSWCAVEIPDELKVGNYSVSFCSDVCARSALQFREFENRKSSNKAYTAAANTIRRLKNPARLCKQCGVSFHPSEDSAEFCSVQCVGAYRTYIPERNCAHCGTIFKPANSARIYCSKKCGGLGRRRDMPITICAECGISFRQRKMENNQKFCSMSCRRKHGSTTVYYKNCFWCGEAFTAQKISTLTCGQSCGHALNKVKSGRKVPKRISPYVFDYFFKQAA